MKTTLLIAYVLAGLVLPGVGPTAHAKEPNPPTGFRAIFNGMRYLHVPSSEVSGMSRPETSSA